MVVSGTDKAAEFITKVLPSNQFNPIISVHDAGEAKRTIINQTVDIIIINAPLPDEFGTQLAIDIAEDNSIGILMMVNADMYEQVTYKVENYGILTISRPCNSHDIFQTLKLLLATKIRLKAMEDKAASLEEKMKEIRIVNRAKSLLMDRLQMSEPEAHR